MKGLTVLGSTGSIGVSTLDVVARHPDKYRVIALTANRDVETMLVQCARFKPKIAVMADAEIVEAGPAQTVLQTPQSAMTRRLKETAL